MTKDFFDVYGTCQFPGRGYQILSGAIPAEQDSIVECLLEKDVEKRLIDQETQGQRPLVWACTEGQSRIVQMLTNHGADINAKSNGKTPLYVACERGQADVVDGLFQNFAMLQAKHFYDRYQGCTSLYIASRSGYTRVVTRLLEHEKKLCADDTDGNLHRQDSSSQNYGIVTLCRLPKWPHQDCTASAEKPGRETAVE